MSDIKYDEYVEALPLPENLRKLLKGCAPSSVHPGLQLDKFSALPLPENLRKPQKGRELGRVHPGFQFDKSSDAGKKGIQEEQKDALRFVCGAGRHDGLLGELLRRRQDMLSRLGARLVACRTTGPLTLHLARASALENAGICLHPLYGFVYLPGSGLKGMARAYAETVWLPTQEDKEKAWETIEDVFGWAPNPDRAMQIKDPDHPAHPRFESDDKTEIKEHAGDIVFHDAWPARWPRLTEDIVNNHHRKYYEGNDAPGDWDSPTMVYFLAVEAGIDFSFAVSKRSLTVEDALLVHAEEWLTGALCHLGAGAKTAAGYGAFKPVDHPAPAVESDALKSYEATLELVTPAFLAGANQAEADCDLRPATLRGLLRWWWRTMHAGYVDRQTLRKMEAAIWGDAKYGGAVRITVEPIGRIEPRCYDYKDRYYPKADFRMRHDLKKPEFKTTQGLFYISHGMDDLGKPKRHYLLPGNKWKITLLVRSSAYAPKQDHTGMWRNGKHLKPALVLEQARAALWLFCYLGGAGSKSGKGFGSFADLDGMSLAKCKETAKRFRAACDCDHPFVEKEVGSPSLGIMLPIIEIPTRWKDCWFALDEVGFSMQKFAQGHAHNEIKVHLGLPRNIDGPLEYPMKHQNPKTWKRPRPLSVGDISRHASPVHYHISKSTDGCLCLRVAIFPSSRLRNLASNRKFLEELRTHLDSDLKKRVRDDAGLGQKSSFEPRAGGGAFTERRDLPQAGTKVEAVLLPDKTMKEGWKAKHEPSGLVGHIVNTGDVPTDRKPGDRVTLIVASCNPTSISFRWPTANDDKPKKQSKPRPRPGGYYGGSSYGRR